MQLRQLPSLGCYSIAVLSGVFGFGFWLQYYLGVQTVSTLSNVILFAALASGFFTAGYVFDRLEATW